MSFFTETVAIPVWLLLLMIGGIVPLFFKLFKLVNHFRRGEIVREAHSDVVLWKVRKVKKTASPKKSATDLAKEKGREKESDIIRVLKAMAAEGDKGVLLKSVTDRVIIGNTSVQKAMQQLVNKKIVEEVVGVSGTKYYLTQVGKIYCVRKGLAKPNK
jgi:hypothetical protein